MRSGRRAGLRPSKLLRGSTVFRRTHPEGGTGHPVSSGSVEPGIEIVRLKSVQKEESRIGAVGISVKGTPPEGRSWRHYHSGCLGNAQVG